MQNMFFSGVYTQMLKEDELHELDKLNRFRFKLIRIRLKLSFMAFNRRMTVKEMFLHTI